MRSARKELAARVRTALTEPRRREALYACMRRGRDARARAVAAMPGAAGFREEARGAKERCLENLDALIERFTRNAEGRGARVYLAKDAGEAVSIALRIAQERGAKIVAKSKSLTTEEIEINHPLEEAGMRVVETDLGELIIQLNRERPYHLVFPAVHKTTAEVAEIFARETGKAIPAEIPSIMDVVRKYLRPVFLNADIGMTGANIGVAENGAIVIETNEGNARLVSAIGRCHICVMGIEKIVETVEDALTMILAHPLSASGQMLTTYVTWLAGRNPLGEDGEPRESHIILLDNGRNRMRRDPLMREALRCIRCGACMNICPTYGAVGGHVFGHIYPGPIGIPWTAEVHGLEKANAFSPLCVSCGLCQEICPVDINIPMMIAEVKDRGRVEEAPPRVNRALMAAETFAKVGCALAPISNAALRNGVFRFLLEKAVGIDRRRILPPFARRTLVKRFEGRPQPRRDESRPQVAFFVDIYANYNRPDLGMAAIERLEALGCQVSLPPQRASGYPYIGYGDLDQARETAEHNVGQLAPLARDGFTIVTTEPTAAYCLKKVYPVLLGGMSDARLVAAHTWEYFEFLAENEPAEVEQSLAGRRFGFHLPCHQRPLGGGERTLAWLRKRGADVWLIETGTCCGMAGTFGMKAGPLGIELANAVGEPLFKAFRDADIEAIVTESSVCAMHVADGTGLPVIHPLEFVRDGR